MLLYLRNVIFHHLIHFHKMYKVKQSKGKVHPRTGYGGPFGEHSYGSTLPLTSALDGMGGQHHGPAALTPRKEKVPIV